MLRIKGNLFYFLFLVLMFSCAKSQTTNSLGKVDHYKEPLSTLQSSQVKKQEIEAQLKQQLFDFLPNFNIKSNWPENISLIYLIAEGYNITNPSSDIPGQFIVKSGDSWVFLTFDYPATAFEEFVEIKADDEYYFIGKKKNNDESTNNSNDSRSQDSKDEEGIYEANFLPSTEQEFQLYEATKLFVGELSKSFPEYEKVYRVPKSGGWAETIVKYFKNNPKGAVTFAGPYDEKWGNPYKVDIIHN
jgi:hypothetical protein